MILGMGVVRHVDAGYPEAMHSQKKNGRQGTNAMSDHALQTSWLRWQPIRFSPRLIAYVNRTVLPPILVSVFLEWRRQGGEVWRAYETWHEYEQASHPPSFLIFYSLIATGFFVWIPIFLRSPPRERS